MTDTGVPARRRLGGLEELEPNGSEDAWPDTVDALIEAAHGLLCNVDGSVQGWRQDDEWVQAADRWMARYDRVIGGRVSLLRAEHVSGVRVEAGPSSPVLSPGPRPVDPADAAVAYFRAHLDEKGALYSGQLDSLEAQDHAAVLVRAALAAAPADAATARASLIPSIEDALFGTTDGHLLPADADVPVGELRRLLRDVWALGNEPVASPAAPRRLAWSLFYEGARVGSIVTDLDTEEWSAGSAATETVARAIALQSLTESPSGGKGAQDADLVESCRAAVLRPGDVPSHLAAAALEELTRARDQIAAGDEVAGAAAAAAQRLPEGPDRYRVQRAVRAWEEAR